MFVYYPNISKLLLFLQFVCVITAIFRYKSLNKTNWNYFVFYLALIFIQEISNKKLLALLNISKVDYFAYFGVPIEFVFFFWLYAIQSLKNTKLFIFCLLLYLSSFFLSDSYFEKLKIVNSINYTIGTLILFLLVILEFFKQIKNDNILEFKQNKMFYINIGVIIFYIGNIPFMGLYKSLLNNPSLWSNYYLYFLLSNCLMYLLFTASFIWGKTKP